MGFLSTFYKDEKPFSICLLPRVIYLTTFLNNYVFDYLPERKVDIGMRAGQKLGLDMQIGFDGLNDDPTLLCGTLSTDISLNLVLQGVHLFIHFTLAGGEFIDMLMIPKV